MSKMTPDTASSEAFIPLMQELAGAYQAFSLYDAFDNSQFKFDCQIAQILGG